MPVIEWADQGIEDVPRTELFDRHYFGGGGKFGGYSREGYWDFPCHEITARHVLARRPESVLEIGCARGYILKRLHDAGVTVNGIEVSKHCYMTRVCNGIWLHDLCNVRWPTYPVYKDQVYDLCFSIATLEHVPEKHLPAIIGEMKRTCKRGLHGIDFGANDDGFDKTHCTLRPHQWWVEEFALHAPGWPVELVDKESLEAGALPPEVLAGDGKVKLNLGSFMTMHHHGWINIDQYDLNAFSGANGYRFLKYDLRQALPFNTGTVDLVMLCHVLEHFDYSDGLKLLREVRRVLKPESGALRVIVPDAELLVSMMFDGCDREEEPNYGGSRLADFNEINEGCANSPTQIGKLWSLLFSGHAAAYDRETLDLVLKDSGFNPYFGGFRKAADLAGCLQIQRETLDMLPCLSLFADAVPSVG